MRLTTRRPYSVCALLLLAITLIPAPAAPARPAAPDDDGVAEGPPGEGELVATLGDGRTAAVPLARTSVRATVSGSAASVEVEQLFVNRYREPIEALYLYPLPRSAAVVDARMRVGDRTLRGEMKRRDEARAAYAAAVASGRRAALVEQRSRDLFTSKVANVPPGERVVVTLRYVQPLDYDAGEYRFEVPLVVRERAARKKAGATAAGAPEAGAKRKVTEPRYLPEGVRPGTNVSISVEVDAGLPLLDVSSPTHQVSVARRDAARATVRLARRDEIPNRDFALRFRVAGDGPQASCAAAEAPDGGAYFAIHAVPPEDAFTSGVVRKEIVFVVDTSGSMSGESIEEARDALRTLVHGLNHGDAFNIVRFSDDVSAFRPAPVPFTQPNVDAADRFVASLAAEGGTVSTPAIRHALAQPRSGDRLRIVAFLTDGMLGDEKELMGMLERELGSSRLFTFGIGDAPDDFLSRKIAQLGRGTSRFVRPGGEMAAVADFQNEVAAPVLTDVSVSLGGARILDLSPSPVPDLYASRPLVLYGRADRMPSGEATIEARGPRGPVRFTVPIRAESGRDAEALGSLYARSRVAALLDRLREAPDDASIEEEIVALGLAHRVVTPFTAFVVLDDRPAVPEGTRAKKVTVPLARPEKPAEAPAPDPGGGPAATLRVRVVDPAGASVPGASVELSSGERGVTDHDGVALFPDVPPGSYAVTVEAPGFATTRQEGVAVSSGQALGLDVVLHVAATTETVTVTSGEEAVDGAAYESDATLEAGAASLPLNGRAFVGIAKLEPGLAAGGAGPGDGVGSGGGSVSGQRVVTRRLDGSVAVVDKDMYDPVAPPSPSEVRAELLRTQLVDGSWGDRVLVDDRIARTAEAVLAFLEDGHTDRAGAYRAQVRRALDFLASRVGWDGALLGATSARSRELALRALTRAAELTHSPRYAAAARRLSGRSVFKEAAASTVVRQRPRN